MALNTSKCNHLPLLPFKGLKPVRKFSYFLIFYKKLSDLAHGLSEPPSVSDVKNGGEWYRDKNEEEVASSQTDYEHVRLGSHPLVGEDCIDECGVADQSYDEDDPEGRRKDDTADQAKSFEPHSRCVVIGLVHVCIAVTRRYIC